MRALGVALMVMAGTVQGAETHRMWVERGWSARDAGRSRECARSFAEATHAAVKERAGQEAIARAGYWTARCAKDGGEKEWRAWSTWVQARFPGSFHARLLEKRPPERAATTPRWKDWVESIILVESGGRPRAISRRGAIGIMQMIPATARTLVPHRFDHDRTIACLLDARCNRRLGERYLDRVLRENDGEWIAALVAYNAGPERAKEWRRAQRGREPIEAIDRIPIRETRNYVARVMSALWRRTHNAGRACATRLDLMNGVWPDLSFSPIRGRSRESATSSDREAVAPRRSVRR